ncbi:SUKH-4 family immunity protein [Kitasatospora sp. NPDC057500]|uniref:SUKH-4 family immunity protein n=1 Tax=Kitasatospora sp. NPDC057500 TaxID=3346151 RepID=UPI0036B2B878
MLVSVDWKAIVEEDLPAGAMMRVRPEAAAEIWSDPADAGFASKIGFPTASRLFRLLDELAEKDPAHPEQVFVEALEPLPVVTPHGRLRQLGELFGGFVFVSLDDGTIWVHDPDADEEYELIHKDLTSLAYLLYKVEGERPRPEEDPSPYDWADAEEYIREDVTRWDPLPFESGAQFWAMFLDTWATM